MPRICDTPIGGAMTIYQLADYLGERGHKVVVAHPIWDVIDDVPVHVAALGQAEGNADPHPWYESRPEGQNLVVPDLSERWLGGPYDAVVINNRKTVAWALRYSSQMGQRIYFLQDYES